ncbi:phosphatase domain-containing protein [Peterkaempfera griseoplana]|uniref:phosphatase domain-containing protein n=1 Tax=Peterkaempfera griseoplana TaxID=66896 RepID=UPI0006E3DB7B|nr:hypothetical protein [Peterkaempfera griseoplana]
MRTHRTPRPLAVFDLDGTLADTRHRLPFLDRRPRDWAAFFAAAPQDPPLPRGVELVLAGTEEYETVYLTGRPEQCRRDTLDWLARHGLPDGRLLMRRGQDRRPARVTKPEMLRQLARGRDVALVVDDDRLVCEAFRAAGFRVVHADWADAEPLLEQAQEEQGRT